MKKSVLLLWLLTMVSLCITWCNTKDYTMSFEDAVDATNNSALQDILLNNENFQQTFDVTTTFTSESSKIDASLQANSKQNLDNKKSESTTTFNVNINADDSDLTITWALDLKLIDNVVYLNLESLGLSWPEDTSFVEAMLAWFKNQWYSIPMTGLNDMPSSLSSIKDTKELSEKAKEIIINEWSTVYNWKFNQFSWYNAWKFSLDNEKLLELVKEYYDSLNESLNEEEPLEMPELNIQNFEWYLVITWKNKVTTVIDNMDMVDGETTMNVNGFWGIDYEINMSANWEPLLTFTATKKNWNYNVSLNVAKSIKLEWVVTPKLSSSNINIKFDATLTIKPEDEEANDSVIPVKGSWTYNPIADFTVTVPENSQDLTEMLSAYLWGMLWWSSYADYDYEDNWDEWESTEEVSEPIEETAEVLEPAE